MRLFRRKKKKRKIILNKGVELYAIAMENTIRGNWIKVKLPEGILIDVIEK